jgi:hypothetical protein
MTGRKQHENQRTDLNYIHQRRPAGSRVHGGGACRSSTTSTSDSQMTQDSQRTTRSTLLVNVAWTTVLVFVPLIAYVVLYYANVSPKSSIAFGYGRFDKVARYKVANTASKIVFRPMEIVDRQLRPNVWTFDID